MSCHPATRTWEVLVLQIWDSGDCSHELNPSLPHVSKFVHYQGFRCSCETVLILITFFMHFTENHDFHLKWRNTWFRWENKIGSRVISVQIWTKVCSKEVVRWGVVVIQGHPFLRGLELMFANHVCYSCDVAKETFESLLRVFASSFGKSFPKCHCKWNRP